LTYTELWLDAKNWLKTTVCSHKKKWTLLWLDAKNWLKTTKDMG